MKMSALTKPIGLSKAHAAEIVRHMGERQKHLVSSRDGEAKVVSLSTHSTPKDSDPKPPTAPDPGPRSFHGDSPLAAAQVGARQTASWM